MGPYDHPTAHEWVADLLDATEAGFLRQSLQPGNVELDVSEVEAIRAAAATVAAGLGLAMPDLPAEVARWLATHPRLNLAALLPLARTQLRRILARPHPDPAWTAATTLLLERLSHEVTVLPGCKVTA
jgi:hypothetical protein